MTKMHPNTMRVRPQLPQLDSAVHVLLGEGAVGLAAGQVLHIANVLPVFREREREIRSNPDNARRLSASVN